MAQSKKNKYDDEPVFFCKDCGSLRIVSIEGIDFCDTCKKDNIAVAKDIETYQEIYEKRYKRENKEDF